MKILLITFIGILVILGGLEVLYRWSLLHKNGFLPTMNADFDGDVLNTTRLGKRRMSLSFVWYHIITKRFVWKLYEKIFEANLPYGYNSTHKIKCYIKFEAIFTLRAGLLFKVKTPNFSFCSKNPFLALIQATERNLMSYVIYQRMKEDLRSQDLWSKLDPEFKGTVKYDL